MALMRTEDQWKEFFLSAGIEPTDTTLYIKAFMDNGFNEKSLPQLDKDTLKEVGITSIGHILAILECAKTHNRETLLAAATTKATITAKLSQLSHDMTHPQFRKFQQDWKVYKQITRLQSADATHHLYNTCDDDVQVSLINSNEDFLSLGETEAMKVIESTVTVRVNPAVHRKSFGEMRQGETETVKAFVVRLRSAACDCAFQCPSCEHDLSPINIKDQLIQGLVNSTLQAEILAKANQLKTLDDIINHAEAFETAQRDQSTLMSSNKEDSDTAFNFRTNNYRYKGNKQFNKTPPFKQRPQHQLQQQPFTCIGCGQERHNRASKCAAWGKQCLHCGLPNHFANVCNTKFNEKRLNTPNDIRKISFLSLSCKNDDVEELMVVNNNHKNQDEIDCLITTGYGSTHKQTHKVFPDSGASICLAGTDHINKMGIFSEELIPCNKKISVVGGSTLPCIGWTPASFTVDGNTTHQRLYVCDKIDRIFLSKQACIDTKILPPTYPRPMSTIKDMNPSNPKLNLTVERYSPPSPNQRLEASEIREVKQSDTHSDTYRRTPPQRPKCIPFPPNESSIPLLRKYIVDSFKKSAFDKTPPLPKMNTKKGHIHLQKNAIPHAVHSPIPVPLHEKNLIKEMLDLHVQRGIITPVPLGTPVVWCALMVLGRKKDGSPRITVDYQHLNHQSHRETHHTETPFQLAFRVPPNTKKTVLDATDSYHSIELDEESRSLTMFITEWGRYMYLRVPQGFFAAGDIFTSRYDDITKDISNKVKIVDDLLLYSLDIESSFWDTWNFLTICTNSGIVINEDKFQFCQNEVEFAGLNITNEGITPSHSMLSAIADFPPPNDITTARSWFGLVNQVSWAYSISPLMEPFRDMIKPNRTFYWDNTLKELFESSKKEILSKISKGVKSFETGRRTCLQTDWCRHGIGYLLLQKHCQCENKDNVRCCPEGWKLVYAGSRFTKDAETRYKLTEGEALAVAWGLQHSRLFTLGCPDLLISVDHEPLLGIFKNQDLNSIKNPRIQNFKEATLAWRFNMSYNPGKWHKGPDAVSRKPSPLLSISLHSQPERQTHTPIDDGDYLDPSEERILSTGIANLMVALNSRPLRSQLF